MQKAKFQIKGIHCNSCVALIEKKLKGKPGIVQAKVNFDSQKAVVIYDEQKIKEDEIYRLVEEAGDYRAEKTEEIKNNKDKGSRRTVQEESQKNPQPRPAKIMFILGLLTAISILSVSLNIFFLINSSSISAYRPDQKGTAQIGDLPFVPNNDAQEPLVAEENAPLVRTFTITKDDNIRGDFNAPITLVEFSDFECPFCERHYPTLNKVLADYKGKVRLVYKHFPLGFHPNAPKAAEASECAGEQKKFWEYHDKLFDNFNLGYSLENFKKWAKDLGLNASQFNDCLDSGKFVQKVQADYQEGSQKGVQGTPATFVNGQLVSGALPYESFKQIIDGLLTQQ